jgi:hypothetical protein
LKRITPQNIILSEPINILLFVVLVFTLSCAAKKDMPNPEPIVEINPKLILLNYTLTEDANGIKSVGFINKTVTDGKARHLGDKYIKTGNIGDLKCSQLDQNSQTLRSVFIKNPLNKTMEFINDSLKFESQAIELKKTSFSLRLQLHDKAKSIIIAEVIDSLQNTHTLFITKLDAK